MIQMSNEALIPIVRIDGPRGGGVNWAFFKFLKQYEATLTYAILVRLNSPTDYLSKLHKLTKILLDMKLSKVELSYDL